MVVGGGGGKWGREMAGAGREPGNGRTVSSGSMSMRKVCCCSVFSVICMAADTCRAPAALVPSPGRGGGEEAGKGRRRREAAPSSAGGRDAHAPPEAAGTAQARWRLRAGRAGGGARAETQKYKNIYLCISREREGTERLRRKKSASPACERTAACQPGRGAE